MILPAIVDRIFEVSRIEDVVSDFISLKKRGVNMIGLCPFHDEKTPSFTVSPIKNICKCFGCGKGGNPINFLMELEQLSYPDALRYLAKKYNIEIQEEEFSAEELQAQNDRESMLILNSFAQKKFSEQLLKDEEGKSYGLGYLMERGFRNDIILKFQLGYAMMNKSSFTQFALYEGYSVKFLEMTGLTTIGTTYQADRFRGRVMFPIHGMSGRVIGFGGRIIRQEERSAKYLNSPDSLIYHKGSILYGLFFAKQTIAKLDNCFVVEGYTDVLSMHQVGVENVVASSGTAFTLNQIRLIKRFTSNITMIFDGDFAGINASIKGIDLILKEGLNVKVLPLPKGEDPDTFFKRKSYSEFIEYLDVNILDFIHFKSSLIIGQASKDPIKRAEMISDIIRSISLIPNSITRSVYIRECNHSLGINEQDLYLEVKKFKVENEAESRVVQRTNNPEEEISNSVERIYPFDLEEKNIIRILVKYGSVNIDKYLNIGTFIIDEMERDQLTSQNPIHNKIFKEYILHSLDDNFDSQRFFTMYQDPDVSSLISDLLSEAHQLSKMYEVQDVEYDNVAELAERALMEYKLRILESRINDAMNFIKEAQNGNDQTAMMEWMGYIQELKRSHSEMLKFLGGRVLY